MKLLLLLLLVVYVWAQADVYDIDPLPEHDSPFEQRIATTGSDWYSSSTIDAKILDFANNFKHHACYSLIYMYDVGLPMSPAEEAKTVRLYEETCEWCMWASAPPNVDD